MRNSNLTRLVSQEIRTLPLAPGLIYALAQPRNL